MVDPFSMNNLNERSRAFVFTTNNPSSRNTPVLETLGAKYLIYGRETAPVTGTPHLQGYVYFSNARTLRTVVAKLPGSHVAVARGSCKQNYEYCTKAGDYDEYGEKPSTPKRKERKRKRDGEGLCHAPKKGSSTISSPNCSSGTMEHLSALGMTSKLNQDALNPPVGYGYMAVPAAESPMLCKTPTPITTRKVTINGGTGMMVKTLPISTISEEETNGSENFISNIGPTGTLLQRRAKVSVVRSDQRNLSLHPNTE